MKSFGTQPLSDYFLEPYSVDLTAGRMSYVDEGKGETLLLIS